MKVLANYGDLGTGDCYGIGNPKFEIRNTKQIQNLNWKCSKLDRRATSFGSLNFGFGICFGFRVSDFEFLANPTL